MIGRKLTALLRGPSQFVRISAPTSNAQSYLRLIASTTRRTYATPGRPRSTVGEPSRPIKRTVKRTSTTTTTAAKVKPRKVVAKKPKKKVAAKKPKKAVKVKKELTPEQVTAKKQRAEAALVRELKKTALKPPSRGLRVSPFGTYMKARFESLAPTDGKINTRDHVREFSKSYKALTPAEMEHYNHLAGEAQRKQQAEYQTWLDSHSTEQIESANSARRKLRLRERKPKNTPSAWPAIEDPRIAKEQAYNPYIAFVKSRHASGDLKHIALLDASKLIAQEWNALSQEEKEKFKSIQVNGTSQQATTFAADVGYIDTTQPQAAAAAA